MLVCKVLQTLPRIFETFISSCLSLSKNEDRTFDELKQQLCMLERNFIKAENSYMDVQEALVQIF